MLTTSVRAVAVQQDVPKLRPHPWTAYWKYGIWYQGYLSGETGSHHRRPLRKRRGQVGGLRANQHVTQLQWMQRDRYDLRNLEVHPRDHAHSRRHTSLEYSNLPRGRWRKSFARWMGVVECSVQIRIGLLADARWSWMNVCHMLREMASLEEPFGNGDEELALEGQTFDDFVSMLDEGWCDPIDDRFIVKGYATTKMIGCWISGEHVAFSDTVSRYISKNMNCALITWAVHNSTRPLGYPSRREAEEVGILPLRVCRVWASWSRFWMFPVRGVVFSDAFDYLQCGRLILDITFRLGVTFFSFSSPWLERKKFFRTFWAYFHALSRTAVTLCHGSHSWILNRSLQFKPWNPT